MSTNLDGRFGSGLGSSAHSLLDRVESEIGAAAKALGLDDLGSSLDRLMNSPSPLQRFMGEAATPAAEKPAAAPEKPATQDYTVHKGDTLSKIATRHGTDVQTLVRMNGLADPDRLSIGQKLTLPAGGQTRTATPAPTASGPAAAATASGAATTTGTTGLSQKGMDFLYQHEAKKNVSDRLHWPKAASGVTLGAGYDMKGRSAESVTRDLTAIGIDPATAQKAAQGAGLKGTDARDFARANADLVKLTPAQEKQLLSRTVQSYADHVRDAIKVPVTQHQFDAMVSFAYNIGKEGFDGSTALRKLNAGDADGAAEAMKMWNKSDGAVVQGLVNRRNDEVELFHTASAPLAAATGKSEAPAKTEAPATSGGTRSATELAGIIEAKGDAQAKADLAAGRKVVVALRTETSANANGGKGVYDDQIAVVWKDAGGTLHSQQFRGNTEPSGQYSTEGPKASRGSSVDANGDGKNDLGRLQAGTIRYQQQAGKFLGNTFFRATQTQVAERDTNHDGRFDAQDANRIDTRGAGTSMLIHQGGANNSWSAGCQTLPGSDFNAFVGALGGQKAFSYVLVDAK